MMRKVILVVLLLIIGGAYFVSGEQQTVGPLKAGDTISLKQTCGNCTYCNISSLEFPNGSVAIGETSMAKSGTEYTSAYTLNSSVVGTYVVNGHCDVDGVDTVWAYDLIVTQNGKEVPEGLPIFNGILILVFFGVAFFMVWLSIQVVEMGPKIFFFVLSFVFLLVTMMAAYQVSTDINVASALSGTTGAIVFVTAILLFVVFIYILIRQTVTILDMYKFKKGLKWGAGVTGYQNNNWMTR